MARTPFLAAVALYAAALAVGAGMLPERVPLHFGLDNQPDRYGSRTEFVAVFAAGGLGTALLFAGIGALASRLPLDLVNVRHADHWKTPEHEGELRGRIRADLLHLGTATILLLTTMVVLTVAAARSDTGRLSGWSYAAVAGYLAYVAAFCGWMVTTRYRPPAG